MGAFLTLIFLGFALLCWELLRLACLVLYGVALLTVYAVGALIDLVLSVRREEG